MKIFIYILLLLQLAGCTHGAPQMPSEENPKEIPPIIELPEEETENEIPKENKTLFHDFEEEASIILNNMTIESKIGQMFLARCPDADNLDLYLSMKPGGFIMFGKDFSGKSKKEVVDNINYYQNNSFIPMIIAVDEEGGTVVRVSSNPNLSKEIFKSPQELYVIGGFEAIKEETMKKSILLKSLGINLNLNPVADVSTNEEDFIFDRSFGKTAEETAKYVEIVIKTAKENKISSTLKHFPGYGNNADTHTGFSYDKRPYEEFLINDFLPFKSGINAGAESILVSHNIVESMDAELPASLSKNVIDILKNELEFTGIIMTDDLSMKAIVDLATVYPPEVTAVTAGNDMLIVTDFKTGYENLLYAVKNGGISEERIDSSVLKILEWKIYMGLMQ